MEMFSLRESNRSQCRSCAAPILWTVTQKSGKKMPVDLDPVEGGNFLLVDDEDEGHILAVHKSREADYSESSDGFRYESHYATCPQAAGWRK